MEAKILGCSGGISGSQRTTSILIDEDILIDAGTGVIDLSFEALLKIDHIFVTHSHLDHIVSIPLLIDTVAELRDHPVVVYALPETIEVLKKHIFNWQIWPDFSILPNAEQPLLRYQAITIGQTIEVEHRRFTVLPARHIVPSVGYQITSLNNASLVFTGDTGVNPEFWPIVNQIPELRYLIIETAFCNAKQSLALASKHLCPNLLAQELTHLKQTPEIFITHLKPGALELTMQEIEQAAGDYNIRMLKNGQSFTL